MSILDIFILTKIKTDDSVQNQQNEYENKLLNIEASRESQNLSDEPEVETTTVFLP
jgi:hypothetical protein